MLELVDPRNYYIFKYKFIIMPPRIEHKQINGISNKLCKGYLCTKEDKEGIWKLLSEFGLHSQNWDGLRGVCKECKNYSQRKEANVEVAEVKQEVKQEKKTGRPKKYTADEIEKLLANYNLFLLEDIKDTDHISKAYIHGVCDLGHEFNTRFDTVVSWINDFKNNTRYQICTECNAECKEMKNLLENENLVEEKGFKLAKMYNNERSDIIYDIECKNGHVTIGRIKGSFIRSFSCKECEHTKDLYNCGDCKQLLSLDKFNKCETNIYRNKTDHNCRECREKQRSKRFQNGYKIPSKNTIIENGIEGKLCCTKECGFKQYTEFYKDSVNSDNYDKYCKKCKNKINKKYAANNKEKNKENKQLYRQNNKEIIYINRKKWIENNKERYDENNRKYVNNRRKNDPNFKILGSLRHRINMALKGSIKSASTVSLTGCTVEELWNYLESQFVEGMTRENYGPVWHVDHIRPCSSFDFTKESEQKKCFHYLNLQPLFATDNLLKSDEYEFDVVHEIKLLSALTE